jgi:DNA polymerase III subunit beta
MKFSVEKEALYVSLQKVSKVIPSRSTLQILSCVLFHVDQDKIHLRTTDLELAMSTSCDAMIEESGSVAIPGRLLMEITAELPDTTLQFSLDGDMITISTLFGGEYKIATRPASEFPSSPVLEDLKEFDFLSEDLLRIIDKTVYCTSVDENKVALTGVLFQFRKNEFRAVATDGHRMVRYMKNDFVNEEYERELIAPTKFLSLASSGIKGIPNVALGLAKNHIRLSFDGTVLYSRIIAERFPDYESVLPMNNRYHLTTDLDNLIAMVKRIAIFSSRNTTQVTLNFTENHMLMSTTNSETNSSAKEEMDVVFPEGELTISFNGDFLKEMLRHIDGEQVTIGMNGTLSAALFYPETQREGEDLLMLLMPIRTVS